MRFDQDGTAVRIKYQTTVNGIDGLELYTVMNAMDVRIILNLANDTRFTSH